MRDVFELEPGTEILADDPYIASYPHLLEFFEPKNSFTVGDVVCGAHMVYGWMPTILELYPDAERCDLQAAGDMLTKAKQGLRLEAWEIDALAGLVNNSVVGASKLLHFVAPQTYAIWDSKVYAFVHERRPHHYRVNRRSDLRGLPQRAGHTGPASRVRALSRLDERKGRLPGIAAAGTRACHVPQRADLQRFHLSSGAPRRIDLQPPTTERVVRPC